MRRGHRNVAPEQGETAVTETAGKGSLRTDTAIMLSCEEARRIIPLYLDSELPGVELARFEAHIDVCEGCEYLLAREREWLSSLRAASPLYNVPDQLRQSIELLVRADSSAKLDTRAPQALR